MEQVTVEEAQARLGDLLAVAAAGVPVIIVAADQAQFQLVRIARPNTYMGHDGLLYYHSRGQILDEQAGIVYYPGLPEPPQESLQPGSATGLIAMSEDFDEPLEDFREYME